MAEGSGSGSGVVLRGSLVSDAVLGRFGEWFRVAPGGSGQCGFGLVWRFWNWCAGLVASILVGLSVVPGGSRGSGTGLEVSVQVPRVVSVPVFKARDSYICSQQALADLVRFLLPSGNLT